MLPQEKANATRLISIWDFEGFLKYSPLFYGYINNIELKKKQKQKSLSSNYSDITQTFRVLYGGIMICRWHTFWPVSLCTFTVFGLR